MKLKEITVNYGETFNMGNYESLRLDVAFRAQIEGDEKPEDIVDHLHRTAKTHVRRLANDASDER